MCFCPGTVRLPGRKRIGVHSHSVALVRPAPLLATTISCFFSFVLSSLLLNSTPIQQTLFTCSCFKFFFETFILYILELKSSVTFLLHKNMQSLVSLLVPLTLFMLLVSGNLFMSTELELNLYRRDPSPEPAPQGVYDTIAPPGGSPAGCATTVPYKFSLAPRDPDIPFSRGSPMIEICESASKVAMTLTNGILLDKYGKIGSIVANRQFQFDGPPAQAGAIYTGGWSVCDDNTLALGPSKQFFKCLSGTCMCFLLVMVSLTLMDANVLSLQPLRSVDWRTVPSNQSADPKAPPLLDSATSSLSGNG
jgi:hypothetical protein